jgi:hypothetical protein
LVAVACLAILIAIALWVISVIARGGLIAGVQQIEEEGSTTFGSAWRVGASRFWTLFGIGILAVIPFILLLIAGGIAAAIFIAGAVGVSEAPVIAGLTAGITCGSVFCCGMIILGIILGQIRIYAERAAVIEGLGWLDAFGRGWQVLKDNLGATILYWLIFLAIGIVLGFIIFGFVLATLVPFIAIVANTDLGAWVVAPICCGGLIGVILGALLNAIVETFSSATWTLAYREMIGMAAPEQVEVAAE